MTSIGFYANGQADEVTTADPLYTTFGRTPEERRAAYQEFLRFEEAEQDALFESAGRPQGDQEFVRRLVSKDGRMIARRRGGFRVRKIS